MRGQVKGEWVRVEGKCGYRRSSRVMGKVEEAWEEWERVRKWESMERVGQGRMWEEGECQGSVKGVGREWGGWGRNANSKGNSEGRARGIVYGEKELV